MEPILFSFKRIFHKSIALGKDLLKDYGLRTIYGLTPSRFDMLHALFRNTYPILQKDLRRVLGVTAPTISRMLDSLEGLGHVLRVVAPGDRRHRRVSLTDGGRATILSAMRAMFVENLASRAVKKVVCPDQRLKDHEFPDEWHRFNSKLAGIRMCIGDMATLPHALPDINYEARVRELLALAPAPAGSWGD